MEEENQTEVFDYYEAYSTYTHMLVRVEDNDDEHTGKKHVFFKKERNEKRRRWRDAWFVGVCLLGGWKVVAAAASASLSPFKKAFLGLTPAASCGRKSLRRKRDGVG